MKLSLRATTVVAAIFAGICLSVAITGFVSLGDLADPVQRADARGFALFWAFLGSVAVALGVLAWWMAGRADQDEHI